MTSRHVALIRGINVGKAKRIAMADLKELVESLGYRDVATLLNSGNVVFSGAAKGDAAARIEKAIAAKAGFSARVLVLSASDVATIAEENPFGKLATDPSRFLVTVPNDPKALRLLAPLTKERWEPDALALGSRAAYLWCPSGILKSPVLEAVSRALRDECTSRNWATMAKLLAML